MTVAKARLIRRLGAWIGSRDAELRLWVRTMAAGMIAFVLAQVLNLPQGYWAVLTAIIVMQASLGGSVKATIDRLIGTLSGAVWGAIVGFFLPRATGVETGVALFAALLPLNLLAAINPSFRLAPITAIIVMLSASSQHLGAFASAFDRTVEIGLGSIVGLGTALVVLPARAHRLVTEASGRILNLLADLLPAQLRALEGNQDATRIATLQAGVRNALAALERVAGEARQERRTHLTADFDPDPLLRTMVRLRHDLVIVGRAAAEPLPGPILDRLRTPLDEVAAAAGDFLRAMGNALVARRPPPEFADLDRVFDGFNAALAAVRRDRLTRDLPSDAVERVFALGFSMAQLRRDLRSLAERAAESARPAA